MKKTLIILSIIALVSCKKVPNNEQTLVITVDEYNRLKDGTAVSYPKPFEYIDYDDLIENGKSGIVLGTDGHEYIVNKKGFDRETFVHSPECPKCEAKLKEIIYQLATKPKDSVR
jgi:hypothetical protein